MIRLLIFCLLFGVLNIALSQNLTIYRSNKDVDRTVKVLIDQIKAQENLIYFETVSHDELASERGLVLAPTRSILFEDPQLSTELLNCRQTAALDLPLELLVWEEHGDVYIGFMDPKFMIRRFMITDCDDTINQMTRLMIKVTMNSIREMK